MWRGGARPGYGRPYRQGPGILWRKLARFLPGLASGRGLTRRRQFPARHPRVGPETKRPLGRLEGVSEYRTEPGVFAGRRAPGEFRVRGPGPGVGLAHRPRDVAATWGVRAILRRRPGRPQER